MAMSCPDVGVIHSPNRLTFPHPHMIIKGLISPPYFSESSHVCGVKLRPRTILHVLPSFWHSVQIHFCLATLPVASIPFVLQLAIMSSSLSADNYRYWYVIMFFSPRTHEAFTSGAVICPAFLDASCPAWSLAVFACNIIANCDHHGTPPIQLLIFPMHLLFYPQIVLIRFRVDLISCFRFLA